MSRSQRRDPPGREPKGSGPEDRGASGAGEARAADSEAPAGESAAPGAEAARAPAAEAESAEVLRDRWLRAEAELQNFRRRSVREWEEARRGAEERVFLELIAAIDDLERALEAARESGAPEEWMRGVRLTVQRLRDYLSRQGVTTLDPVGSRFDPTFHEAMLEIDAPAGAAPGDVVQVVLKGYARGDRTLRPARVVVARVPRPAAGQRAGASPAEGEPDSDD